MSRFYCVKTILKICCLTQLALGLVFTPPGQAASSARPLRIALITGGPYYEFQLALQGFAERLAELGIIVDGNVPLPEETESLAPMWQRLAKNAGGNRLRFVADAFYSSEWEQEQRPEVKNALLKRLKDKGDIDCVLALGTWGGQDIGLESLRIPVLVFQASNAVEAGIILSSDDSGRDNLLATVDPDRHKNQVRIFHTIIGFSRLGITYEDTPTGRTTIALGDIEEAAKELGIELLRCTNVSLYANDKGPAESRLRACHEYLVKQGAEAVYLTYNLQGLGGKHTAYVLDPLIKANLPTFAQQGSYLVKLGALMSVTNESVKEEGRFVAEALEKIMNGSPPRSLPQRYKSAISLVVNLNTATLIGWNLPMEILAGADEFYQD